MARIRTIKPEFFTDSKVLSLAPLARLFYVSLWCEADRAGRLKWDPATLKFRYLPADKASVEDLGHDLLRAQLIRLYEVDGQIYADIPGFVKHQVINNREVESSLPAYSDDACVTRESGDTDAARGKEGRKGRERKEGTTPVVPKAGDEYSEDFRKLVEAYPRRQGTNPLPRAWRAYKLALERGATQETLLRAARAYAATDVAGTKFCQQLATWLNGDEWKTAPVANVTPLVNAEDSLWEVRCKGFYDRKFWNRDQWGPRPDEPGCKAPKRFLKTFDPVDDMPAHLRRADLTMAG